MVQGIKAAEKFWNVKSERLPKRLSVVPDKVDYPAKPCAFALDDPSVSARQIATYKELMSTFGRRRWRPEAKFGTSL